MRQSSPAQSGPALSERRRLEPFRARGGDVAVRDAQDLMAYPFFSLAKSHRTTPIDFRSGDVSIRVEAVRKHGGRQRAGWRFDFRHLHLKSGSLSPFKRFAFELRDAVRRQPLPGYALFIEVEVTGRVLLAFEPAPRGRGVDGLVPSGTRTLGPSGTPTSCHREPELPSTLCANREIPPPNLDSNIDSNAGDGTAALRTGGGGR